MIKTVDEDNDGQISFREVSGQPALSKTSVNLERSDSMLEIYVSIQWNLRITDTFGTHCFLATLSFIERLSFIGRLKIHYSYSFGTFSLSFIQR